MRSRSHTRLHRLYEIVEALLDDARDGLSLFDTLLLRILLVHAQLQLVKYLLFLLRLAVPPILLQTMLLEIL